MSQDISETEEFWIPNVEISGIERQLHLYGDSENDQGVVSTDGANETAIFKEFFKKELETIRSAYGKIEIKRGIIIYYS